jgi:SAM-dependent methyltransferase
MKDNFSKQSDNYARFRPPYPSDFFSYLNSLVEDKITAWDCGTGNGQVAFELAKTFKRVYATDISQSQIDHAFKAENIFYSVQPSERTHFEKNQFNLIVTAQAIHWFDFEKFYSEVLRTARENSIICVVGYGRVKISQKIDNIINDFYLNTIGLYWDSERRYIDENYLTIPFPFAEIQTPLFINKQTWNLEHLVGYLNTWSAVKHFIKDKGYNPIDTLQMELAKYWELNEIKSVSFPMLLRIGKIKY